MEMLDVKFMQIMTADKIQYKHGDSYPIVVY